MGAEQGREQQAKPQPQPPSLGQASTALSKKVKDLEDKISKAEAEARDWVARQSTNPGAKMRAMQALKRKKLYETQRDQFLGQQFNVDSLAFQQEQAGITLAAVEAMKQATKQLKAKTDRIGVDQVERLKDDMADLTADMEEISATLAQPGATADDSAEDELAALYRQQEAREQEDAMNILRSSAASPPAVPAAKATSAPARGTGLLRAS